MSDPTADSRRRSGPKGSGWRYRRRAKVLLWRTALGAAGAVGAVAVSVAANRFFPLF